MKTFITEITKEDGNKYEGPKFSAPTWEEAETSAKEQGVIFVGELLV